LPRPHLVLVGPFLACTQIANRLVELGVNAVHKPDLTRAVEWLKAAPEASGLLLVGDGFPDGSAEDALLSSFPARWRCEEAVSEADLQAVVCQLEAQAGG
jgi:hypothetical protein